MTWGDAFGAVQKAVIVARHLDHIEPWAAEVLLRPLLQAGIDLSTVMPHGLWTAVTA